MQFGCFTVIGVHVASGLIACVFRILYSRENEIVNLVQKRLPAGAKLYLLQRRPDRHQMAMPAVIISANVFFIIRQAREGGYGQT